MQRLSSATGPHVWAEVSTLRPNTQGSGLAPSPRAGSVSALSSPALQSAPLPRSPVELLVLGVRSIVRRAHGQQHDVLARGLLERQCHWDAAAFPGQVWLDAKH